MKEGKDGNNREQEKGKENEAGGRTRGREKVRSSARTTGESDEAAPHDRKNFPYKYTRVSLIIIGKRPA